MTDEPTDFTIIIFISYSHKDKSLWDNLKTHLCLLEREGHIKSWNDRMIFPGNEWEGQIYSHLESANIILMLISADFLASNYCYAKEMERAMERYEQGEARVIPVILRPCDWHTAPFGKLQALPTDGKPVTIWNNRDEAFTDIARGIRKVVQELTESKRQPNTPESKYASAKTTTPTGNSFVFNGPVTGGIQSFGGTISGNTFNFGPLTVQPADKQSPKTVETTLPERKSEGEEKPE